MTDARSLYNQIWKKEEVDSLQKDYANLFVNNSNPIHPLLLTFAISAQQPANVIQSIKDYSEWVLECDCWYCLEIREKKLPFGISGQDVWYRLILYANGPPQYQLN